MKVIIATKNPGKIEGAKNAFSKYFEDVELIGIPASSDVGEEPVNEETYNGAKNRVRNLKEYCKKNNINADLYIASESGITEQLGRWMIINLAVIEDNNSFESYGTSAGFPVPEKYRKEIIEKDLQQVADGLYNTENIGQAGGIIGKLTHGEITRINLTEQAFIMALTKYINGEKWN